MRRLTAIENFGSMDIFCTDKTGTLTLGVVSLDQACDPQGRDSESVRRFAWLNAYFQTGMPNPMDEAIITSLPAGVPGADKVDEVPYDFVRKRLSVVVKEKGICTLVCKGALDNILHVCTRETVDGSLLPLTEDRAAEIHNLHAQWSRQGYRVLGVATRLMVEKSTYSKEDETDLTFAGFLLFFDPPKPGVRDAIASLRTLGVHLKIITGDNQYAAMHIAESIGIESPAILTGSQLDEFSAVSYTHLRDHETPEHLVCRLLLEKKHI